MEVDGERVNESFVSKGLLSPAIQMAQRQPAQVERRDNRNLQVSISNRALVGRYLAVELLQKIVDRELR